MIIGIGIDMVEIARIEYIIEKWGSKFLDRVFSPSEIEYCRSRPRPASHFAARFAAKEAFLKALGTGLDFSKQMKNVVVDLDDRGAPRIDIPDEIRREFPKEFSNAHISITHSGTHAGAVVVLEGK